MGGLHPDPVVGVCYGSFPRAGWLHCYVQFIHGHVFSIGGVVSPLGENTPRDTWWIFHQNSHY